MIIRNLPELKKFIESTDCPQCKAEATELYVEMSKPGVGLVKMHFDTDCEHAGA